MIELPKKYNHQDSEKKWQKYWRENQTYKWDKSLPREQTFVIDTPPPTVSGVLHMGHIFSYTQADFIARFQRMSGKTVFYPMGFDDNGLPTERLVEKVKGIRGVNMKRSDFVKECQSVVDEAEAEFENLFNSIALSVDWDEKYQTISPKCQEISQLSFLDLYQKGFTQRQLEPVLWDIVDRTALSQADLTDQEKPSFMNDVEFGVAGSDQKVIIATTRPELMPACVAVMVHPEDSRYKNLIGKKAITALFNVEVPIIADDLVQQDKGTGAVMCCTFGDETDIKWWRQHNLDLKMIVQKDGLINIPQNFVSKWDDSIMSQISGQKIKAARANMIKILQEEKLLLKQEEIKHSVKCAERSGAPIEILVVHQWFIKVLDIKEKLKQKAAECNWYPAYMKVRIDQWIDGVSWDWCISRQRFFGVPFPVWYVKKKGENSFETFVAEPSQLPCDPLTALPKFLENATKIEQTDSENERLVQDEDGNSYYVRAETDIMDTWATSSISPQLSSHGINPEKDGFCEDLDRHQKLFPADLRPQAHEIIRTWAFYTIVKAYLHEEKIPWENLMISGWCLASDKTKMSKSKGNVVTPNALIEEKGSDIVRYWASTSHLGTDTAYSEDVLKIGKKLLNKLFNATKFAAQNFSVIKTKPQSARLAVESGIINQAADLWILTRLNQAIVKASAEFEKFEYAKAREVIEEFFWKDLCDNYLEIIKVRSYGLLAEKYADIKLNDQEKQEILNNQQSAALALYYCLNNILKLFAPFIPHITDELFAAIFPDEFESKKSIHQRGNWPKSADFINNQEMLRVGNESLLLIAGVRKYKSDNNLSMKTPLKKLTVNSKLDLSSISEDLANVCNAEQLVFCNKNKLGSDIQEASQEIHFVIE